MFPETEALFLFCWWMQLSTAGINLVVVPVDVLEIGCLDFSIRSNLNGIRAKVSSLNCCVITRFWPNQEVGRTRDGLGRLHVGDL